MTVRTVTYDQRYSYPLMQGGTATVGRYYKKDQSGSNYLPGEPSYTPHPYSMQLVDSATGILRLNAKNTAACLADFPAGGLETPISVASDLVRAWTSNDDLALYGKLSDKYDDMAFNTPLFAGELGETTDMLAGRVRQLAAVGKAVKKGNLVKAAKLLGVQPPSSSTGKYGSGKARLQREQTLAEGWLELRYGWEPLLSDITDLADAIAKRDLPRKQRLSAYHFVGRTIRPSLWYAEAEGTGRFQKSIVAYVEEVLPNLASRMGLQDPLSVGWELLPFSFVADWVLPVGDYLKARHLATHCKGQFVLTTTDWWRGRIVGTVPITNYCMQPDVEYRLLSWYTYVNMVRTVHTELPAAPPPSFRIPFTGPCKRLYDAVALVRSIFGNTTHRRV